MKKFIFPFIVLCALLFCVPQSVKSQEASSTKAIFGELGGPGVLFSVNFDSRIKKRERLGLGYRAGVGFCVATFKELEELYSDLNNREYRNITRSYYTIPVGINYILGREGSAHSIEVGAGATYLTREVSLFYYDVKTPGHFIGHVVFMYRRVPVDGGFSFRVGFTPIIGTSGDLVPMAAIGIGHSF